MTEEKTEKTTRKRKKYIPVKLIASKDKAIVVEWLDNGVIQRGILPNTTVIKDNKIEESVLFTAIQYGVPWDEFNPGDFDAQKLAELLHQKGIWTLEDARNDLRMFGQVLLQVIGATRNDLLNFAKQFENTK